MERVDLDPEKPAPSLLFFKSFSSLVLNLPIFWSYRPPPNMFDEMIKFHHLTLIALLVVGNSCKGQIDQHTKEDRPSKASLVSPVKVTPIVGTPSPSSEEGLVSQYIRTIFQDSKGHFWFGPAGQSVARYDGQTLTYFDKADFFKGNLAVTSDFGNSVHAVEEDHKGNLWFGTYQGLVKYDGKGFRSYLDKDGLSGVKIGRGCILEDRNHNLWVGTTEGVFLYNPQADSMGERGFSPFELVPTVAIKDIMEDKNGGIWFATEDQGVFCYQDQALTQLNQREGLGNNYAGGMAQDQAGNFWFTMKEGICRYDGKTFWDVTKADGIGGTEIWGLLIEESGIIWITARGATTRFNPSLPQDHPKAMTVYTPKEGLNCCVQSMYQDQQGKVWWGAGSGLFRFDGERFFQVKQNGPW
ncbi:MAG: two-component regulator propeller domain-containing protein [Bacteroidota bacterium]